MVMKSLILLECDNTFLSLQKLLSFCFLLSFLLEGSAYQSCLFFCLSFIGSGSSLDLRVTSLSSKGKLNSQIFLVKESKILVFTLNQILSPQ